MSYILISFILITVGIVVPMAINNAKLKAANAKLRVEKQNLEYELGKQMLDKKEDKELSNDLSINKDRINNIKEKFKNTEELPSLKRASKEDVEAFYKEHGVNTIKKGRRLEK